MAASGLPKGAQRLADETWYLPGLTNSGYIGGLVIDTGPEAEAYDGVTVDVLAVTHGHADHFSAGARIRSAGARVAASRDDARMVENPEVNIRGMFSWAKPGDEMVTKLFVGDPCPVDLLVEDWTDERARAIPLPGHTLGHFGMLTADGVLFTGDALYQRHIWEQHRLPYSIDSEMVAASLRVIEATEFECLVPGHGEPCDREAAESHILHHLERIDALELFLERTLRTARTTEEAIALVSEHVGLVDKPALYWLAVTTVKGYLGKLLSEGRIEFFVKEHSGWWRTVG